MSAALVRLGIKIWGGMLGIGKIWDPRIASNVSEQTLTGLDLMPLRRFYL